MSPSRRQDNPNRWNLGLYSSIIIIGIAAVYWPVSKFDFVNFDDPAYVRENSHVQLGLTLSSLKWAFSSSEASNWHPLTWISHMLDFQVYGRRAGGHHLTSVLLHGLNSCLLFSLFRSLTAKPWVSFFVAALFAWHPAHAESVAWVAERKDVLSVLFGLLGLSAYVRYVEKLGIRSSKVEANSKFQLRMTSLVLGRWSGILSKAGAWYVLALGCFALALMSKPMLVTLPFILWLLDFWPLRRLQTDEPGPRNSNEGPTARACGPRQLLLEKVPFLAITAASCAVTVWAQARGGAITSLNNLQFGVRAENAALSYLRYIQKLFWPVDLAVFYPYFQPESPVWPVLGGVLLLVISIVVFILRGRLPYLTTGWFWYLAGLLPVIGLIQVGSQAMADRYTYFPSIGIFVMVAFGASEMTGRWAAYKPLVAAIAACALGGCLLVTSRQVLYWQNSETLYRHAIAVTEQNFVACNNLGAALEDRGEKVEATRWYLEAIRIKPDYADAHCNLGKAYITLKQPKEAVAEFQAALQLNPGSARVHYFLANALLAERDLTGAEAHYRTALALKPVYPEAEYQLAVVSAAKGDIAGACACYREALRLNPNWPEALNNLAWTLAANPDAQIRNGQEAVALAMKGLKLTHTNDARLLDTLGGALAEVRRFPEAAEAARTAIRMAETSGMEPLVREINEHLQHYERHEPFRDRPAGP